MGFLDSINPANMLSNAAESLCDAVLPKELEFVGDLAGLAVDFKSGNWMKAIENFQDLAQDLPQQLAHLAHSQAGPGGLGDALMTPSFLEPAPPPPYAAANGHQTTGTTSTTTTVTTTTSGPVPGPESKDPSVRPNFSPSLSLWGGLVQQLPHLAQRPPISEPLAAPQARGTPASSSLPPPSSTGTPSASPSPTPAFPTTASTSAQGTSAPAATTTDATGMSPDAFFNLSDTDLMNAVRDGNLPADVRKNPEQMQRLQLRMNEITEMNQLITSMLKAMHDMNSQVIGNIRV